jgi:hypothetical protein
VSATLTIDVPREQVFDLLCDLSARPAFTDHFVESYRLQRVEPSGVGAAARFRIQGGPWMDTAIEAADRPHTVREHGHGGRSNRIEIFTVWELAETVSSSACEVTVTFWGESSHLFDRIRHPLGRTRTLRRNWARSLRRLRELCESGEQPPRVAVGGSDRLPSLVA